MRILAIDTAFEVCAAAVFDSADGGRVLAQESLDLSRGHAEVLLPLIARVMDASEVEFNGLDRIAVTVGPGSFTGLRVGISAARGIALAAGRPAVGLSTLSAFAAPHVAGDDDERAVIVAAVDARHDQVYLQVFGPGGNTLVAPHVASVREAVRSAMAGPARIVGSAAYIIAATMAEPADSPPLQVDARKAPDIVWVARLGAAARSTDVARRSRSISARPMRGRRRPHGCRGDDRDPTAAVRDAGARAERGDVERMPAGSRSSMRPRSGAAGARTRWCACSRDPSVIAHRAMGGGEPRRFHPVADRGGRGGNSLGRRR